MWAFFPVPIFHGQRVNHCTLGLILSVLQSEFPHTHLVFYYCCFFARIPHTFNWFTTCQSFIGPHKNQSNWNNLSKTSAAFFCQIFVLFVFFAHKAFGFYLFQKVWGKKASSRSKAFDYHLGHGHNTTLFWRKCQ